jgi:hypothetical protein
MMCKRYFSTLKLSGQDDKSVTLLKKKKKQDLQVIKTIWMLQKKADSQFFLFSTVFSMHVFWVYL